MKLTIRTKIIGCMAAGISAVAVGAFLLAGQMVEKGFTDEMLKMGSIATQNIAGEMITSVLSEDMHKINLVIYRLKQGQESVEYSFLTGREGQILASTLGKDTTLKIAGLNPIPSGAEHSIKFFHSKKTGIYDVAYQLLRSDIGELHIGFSDKSVQAKINDFNKSFLLVISLVCLTGLGAAVYLAKRLTNPIENLVHQMSLVRKGNLDAVNVGMLAYQLPNDEIGQLGKTVIHMISDLKASQDQLVQAGKLAAIGQLAAGISHELNSPLGGILGYSQFILEKKAKLGVENLSTKEIEKIFKYVGYIERESQRSKSIVSNLLKFSRASKTEVAPLNINSVLKETFALTKHQLEINKVELIQKLASFLPPIMGNEHQLQQVFTNLMVNAQQSIDEKGTLTVRTALKHGDGHGKFFVEVCFTDTGCGIPKEHLAMLFNPFFTTKEPGVGTGLGLSVSYGIIEAHMGTIEVESEVGKGTTMRIKLGVKSAEEKTTG